MGKSLAIDIFCGCGGMTQGFKDAQHRVIAGLDIDPSAIETYKANHPRTQSIKANIATLSPKTLMARLGITKGQLDVMGGCPPCQGFSALRTSRVGNEQDQRNFLIFEFAEYIKAFMPKQILMENVPGLLRTGIFREFDKRIKRLGYFTAYKVLNTKDYGVPQSRKRAVYKASLKCLPVIKQGDGGRAKTVRDALEGYDFGDDALHQIPENRTARIRRLISMVPKNGGNLPEALQLPCHHRTNGYRDVYGRMAWDKPAPTITGGCCQPSKGRFIHPQQNRCITMREAALLQSFPPKYNFPVRLGKMKIAQMIGNALAAPFVSAQVG